MDPYIKLDSNHEENNIIHSTSPNHSYFSESNRIRLRAVESEKGFFLNSLNTTLLKKLAILQGALSGLIVILQLILYSSLDPRRWKAIEHAGIGLWGPMFFFSFATGLSYLTITEPTGCLIGTALGFQIASSLVGLLTVLVAAISLGMHGDDTHDYDRFTSYGGDYGSAIYERAVLGFVLCSSIVISALLIAIVSSFMAVLYCKATCCGQFKTAQSVLFDVESNKL